MFKALRALRVLKIATHIKKLKKLIISLTHAMPIIINLVLFAFSLILIVGLIPLKYLKGKFWKCSNFSGEFEIITR